MAIPVITLPLETDAYIKQGDTIPAIDFVFSGADAIDVSDKTIKIQLYYDRQLVFTAVTGNGITHTGTYGFQLDKIQGTGTFPVATLVGDLEITYANGDVLTVCNIELTIIKQLTV